MESKGTEEKITYPNIYFTVDNFEDVSHKSQNLINHVILLPHFRRFVKWL